MKKQYNLKLKPVKVQIISALVAESLALYNAIVLDAEYDEADVTQECENKLWHHITCAGSRDFLCRTDSSKMKLTRL